MPGHLHPIVNIAVFMMGALALVVPSGYSIGAGVLLLLSATLLFRHSSITLSQGDKAIIAVLVIYGLAVGGLSALDFVWL